MKSALVVGELEAAPGTTTEGFLEAGRLGDGRSPVAIPLILMCGEQPGLTVYLHVGSHGQEPFYAIEALRRLRAAEVTPQTIRGNLIIVPAANLLAFQDATRIA